MSDENAMPAGATPLTFTPEAPAQAASQAQPSAMPTGGPIVIELADGRKVGMAKPKGSLSEPIANCLADKAYGSPMIYEMERLRLKSLLYVTDVDGEAVIKIYDKITRAALEEKIGDDNLDAVFNAFMQNFPRNEANLATVKK